MLAHSRSLHGACFLMPKKNEEKKKLQTLSDMIEAIIRKNGGIAHLGVIYEEVETMRTGVSKATIRAVIRDACKGTLRRSTDKPRFVRIDKGVYGICSHIIP